MSNMFELQLMRRLNMPEVRTPTQPEEAATPPNKRLLKSAAVMTRFGGISGQTLWRYGRDPELGFPKPIKINGVRYWDGDEIEAFIERMASA